MTQPPRPPAWSALRIGPGGVPADQVHVLGRHPSDRSEPESHPGPSAVFGSFDEPPSSRRAVIGWLTLALVVGVLAALALWSGNSTSAGSADDLQTGDCLTSSSVGAVRVVGCSTVDAEFVVAARFDDTSDEAACSPLASDLVLATHDPAMLCLNYIASVGDCLFAGAATEVGKAPCRTPGSSSTPVGLFRVIAVLPGTVQPRDCPTGTLQSLVHVADREVICLGMP